MVVSATIKQMGKNVPEFLTYAYISQLTTIAIWIPYFLKSLSKPKYY
jgi:hypothetical protein